VPVAVPQRVSAAQVECAGWAAVDRMATAQERQIAQEEEEERSPA